MEPRTPPSRERISDKEQSALARRFARACGLSLLAGAALAELFAAEALWHDAVSRAVFLHFVCVAATTFGVALALAPMPREDALFVAITCVALVGCLPGTGFIGVALVALPCWFERGRARPLKLIERPMPSFSSEALEGGGALGISSKDPLSHTVEVENRVAAVKALRNMEATRAIPLLRRALTDPAEDVRLLAHAILDRRERNVRAKLEQSIALLASADASPRPNDVKRRAHVELASHYWELAYGGFVSGDSARGVLELAAEHAIAASAHPGERVALLIAIRAFLRLRQLTNAERALSRARQSDVPAALLAPLRAELAFLQGRFSEVDDALSSLSPLSSQKPYVAEVTRFWADRGSS